MNTTVKDTYGNALTRLLEYAESAKTAYLNAEKAESYAKPHNVDNHLCNMQIDLAMLRDCIEEIAQL